MMMKKKNGGLFKSGITVRWLFTTILIIALILASIAVSAVLILSDYYYGTVEDRLNSIGQSKSLADYFDACLNSPSKHSFAARAQNYIDYFPDKNIAEIWVFDSDGDIIATSTGFIPEKDEYPDYSMAQKTDSGRALWQGYMGSGEKVMALSVILPKINGSSIGTVRYIISLDGIDKQLAQLAVIMIIVCAFALFLVILSGLFFIHSIVSPLKELNTVTRSIAAGNYSEKLVVNKRYDDELAELAESINYMTDEINKTSRLKNDFISTVSHELRTPLTAIKGWAETLIDINENKDKTINDGLKVIRQETDRLYSLVEDLLDFSRMESGRMTLHLKKTDLFAELDDAVYVLKERAAREGIEIFYSSPDYPAQVNADPDRIKQVFVNIIDNAIKYTSAGGRISVVAIAEAQSVKVCIADTGCGIPPEDLPKVKEKFYKANLSVKGSGIGLAVCDEIISLHHGRLDIQSTVGEGTQVTITLPSSPLNLSERKDS